MDFMTPSVRHTRAGYRVFPQFLTYGISDVLIKSHRMVGFKDFGTNMWSRVENSLLALIDAELQDKAVRVAEEMGVALSSVIVDKLVYAENKEAYYNKWLRTVGDTYGEDDDLDQKMVFADQENSFDLMATRKLSYSPIRGECAAWDEALSLWFEPDERHKIEWGIGAILAGTPQREIQKFFLIHGTRGTGKSTVLEVVRHIFEGHVSTVDLSKMISDSRFGASQLEGGYRIGIDDDVYVNMIYNSTLLNKLASGEYLTVEAKGKDSHVARPNMCIWVGSNHRIPIPDGHSGLSRRLIDIDTTGRKFSPSKYNTIFRQMLRHEIPYIAQQCLDVFAESGLQAYMDYFPKRMMDENLVYAFFEENILRTKSWEGPTLAAQWAAFDDWQKDGYPARMHINKSRFKRELTNHWTHTERGPWGDSRDVWHIYTNFHLDPIPVDYSEEQEFVEKDWLAFDQGDSFIEQIYSDSPAPYAVMNKHHQLIPEKKWEEVTTKLKDIDTSKVHYVMLPPNHIVIDFDCKNKELSDEAALQICLDAAESWAPTYAEVSQSGRGLHLHYIYDGDASKLANVDYEDDLVRVEIKQKTIRRKLSYRNDNSIAHISDGLPLKERNKVLTTEGIKTEMGVRALVLRNLNKDIHPATKPSIDFIHKILEDAYHDGISYDLSDMRQDIINFALGSTHQAERCLEIVTTMKFKSEDRMEATDREARDERLVFFDTEVYPNLFVICWKYEGDSNVVKMINPSSQDIEPLFQYKLIGYNNRNYDNHILYARHLGYDIETLHKLSQRLIGDVPGAKFGEAYELSYCDVRDYITDKKSLKKHQIDLGLNHQEMDIPWDYLVPEDRFEDVANYCVNDVITTEQLHNSRLDEFMARQILADLSGLTINHSTNQHTAQIIFGDNRHPQDQFNYPHLAEEFPGYEYAFGKSTYRDEIAGEGGYVYAEPGMYDNVVLLDVASMHPTTIDVLQLFGPEYTKRFTDMLKARVAIKHKDFTAAGKMLDGVLKPYLTDPEQAKGLSDALKIALNSVYGLTTARHDNKFKDPRNKDNVVAKRGALFMIDLKHYIQERGFQVVHIKTDSVKIPNASDQIIAEVIEFGAKYGYTFEHEATYDKFCLVNDAVYIARKGDKWEAVGAQFQHPYIFKTLFSHEPLEFSDLCETKSVVKGALYLDFQSVDSPSTLDLPDMKFVGKTGLFSPVNETTHGALLYRFSDDKLYSVQGTKGYLWKESHTVQSEDEIDMVYFENLAEKAKKTIEKFGSFEDLVAENPT